MKNENSVDDNFQEDVTPTNFLRGNYLLHGTPVKIAERAGKFMVTVKSDRFHDKKKVFTSDLQVDLKGMH